MEEFKNDIIDAVHNIVLFSVFLKYWTGKQNEMTTVYKLFTLRSF